MDAVEMMLWGSALPIGIFGGAAFAVPPRIARPFVIVAGGIAAASVVLWGATTDVGTVARILVVGILGAAVAVFSVEGVRYFLGGTMESAANPPGGIGGKGGHARVGGSGTATGGQGGDVLPGGRGGDGGSAEVGGDGTATGGAGGKVDNQSTPAKPPAEGAVGGQGGNVSLKGSGIAVGGRGGKAGPGQGRGGTGGGGEHDGDGIVAGGDGGSAGLIDVWPAPARSGYERYMRSIGQKPDPALKGYGRGGTVPGYEERLEIVQQIREEYGKAHELSAAALSEIEAVPLEYVNTRLEAMNLNWRARLVEDEYEFFVPNP